MGPDILIVDDVPANLLALEAALEPLCLNTVRADSGEEAVRVTASREFAAILMDVRMPGMDGVTAAGLIRRRAQGYDVPIVLMSAIDRDIAQIERGYQAGAIDYLVKPLDEQALRAKVSVLVDLWQERQAERQEKDRSIGELEGEVEAANVRFQQLLTWMGHELRNSLSALVSVMQLRQRRSEEMSEWAGTVLRQLNRLRRLGTELSRLQREGGEPPTPIHGRAAAEAPPNRPRVLLVDDNEDALEALAGLLRDAGGDVATASTATEALRVAADFLPDAAVLDIGLPDMDGHELGRRLRTALNSKKIRLYALSGFGSRDDLERSRGAGFDGHLIKPADATELLSLLGLT